MRGHSITLIFSAAERVYRFPRELCRLSEKAIHVRKLCLLILNPNTVSQTVHGQLRPELPEELDRRCHNDLHIAVCRKFICNVVFLTELQQSSAMQANASDCTYYWYYTWIDYKSIGYAVDNECPDRPCFDFQECFVCRQQHRRLHPERCRNPSRSQSQRYAKQSRPEYKHQVYLPRSLPDWSSGVHQIVSFQRRSASRKWISRCARSYFHSDGDHFLIRCLCTLLRI